MDAFKRKQMSDVGPGGITCPCCNNYHSRKHPKGKKKYRRLARHRMRMELRKVMKGKCEI
jgi:hypothetical protein